MSFESALKLAEVGVVQILGERKGKQVSNVLEVVGVICSIVESVANQIKTAKVKPLASNEKLKLAVTIAAGTLDAIKAGNMISSENYGKAKAVLNDSDKLIDMIDGVVAIANASDAIRTITAKGCSCF